MLADVSTVCQAAATLGVVCTDETMLQVLEVTGLNRVFSVYGTRDGALEEESAR